MESLKDMRTIITIANTAALLGISLYFYRRIKILEDEVNKHSDEMNKQSNHLASTVKKLRDIQHVSKNISQLAAAIKDLNFIINTCTNEIKSLHSVVELQRNQINELQSYIIPKNIKSNLSQHSPHHSSHHMPKLQTSYISKNPSQYSSQIPSQISCSIITPIAIFKYSLPSQHSQSSALSH